ncbi:MAG: hypothetical protein WAT79_15645 [Saprospiraceae bacterium]
MMHKAILYIIGCIFIFSCTQETVDDSNVCGEKKYIRMFVKDTLNRPYYFKTSQTYLDDTIKILEYEDLDKPSALVVITDDQLDKITTSINHISVRAYNKQDSLILVEYFKISKDSCHVRYIEGPEGVVIK